MTPVERLLWAYRYGHAWNPSYPNLQNIDEGRVLKMDGSERDAKDMLASFQSSDGNVASLVEAWHGRELEPDGDVGPATEMVMAYQRCAMPDYAPPPNASFDYGDPDLNDAVKSYQEFAEANLPGRGSWPSCDPQRPDVHSVRVNILTAGFSEHQRNLLPECLRMVEDCEGGMGQAVRHIIDGDPTKAEHEIRGQRMSGGTIGFAYFPKPNTCEQTVRARINNSFNANKYSLSELYVHEWKGHSDGLQHTRGGIMNPSIGRPTHPPSWKADPHESTKRKYFGGVALPPVGGPMPVQRPELTGELTGEEMANGIAIRGVTSVVIQRNQPAGTFLFITVPGSGPNRFKFEPKSEV